MNKLTGGQWGTIIAVSIGMTLSRYEKLPTLYPGDIVGFAALGLLLFWLLRRRPATIEGAAYPEGSRQSIAFRLGKALNRVRGGHSR
jgi:hypothetical protein